MDKVTLLLGSRTRNWSPPLGLCQGYCILHRSLQHLLERRWRKVTDGSKHHSDNLGLHSDITNDIWLLFLLPAPKLAQCSVEDNLGRDHLPGLPACYFSPLAFSEDAEGVSTE